MDNLISVKSDLNKNINDILSIINNLDLKDNSLIQELTNKNKILNEANIKFLEEIKEKDKILGINQKTMCDYEKQINNLNEVKEKENKFTMVKAKDKEIHEQNKIINSLKKEITFLKNMNILSSKTLKCEIIEDVEDVEDKTPDIPPPDIQSQDELVDENNDAVVPMAVNNNDDVEQDSDEQLAVETIVWYNKEYYMLEEEGQKKVFEINEDEDMGKELGLWIDDKLVRHDKKKK